MARYSSLFKVATPLDSFRQRLSDVLRSCDCDVIYDMEDYMVAREVPGRVNYARLVTIEVLIDKASEVDDGVQMNVVVKNEELPLKQDNHCRRMFNQLYDAFTTTNRWHLIESIPAV